MMPSLNERHTERRKKKKNNELNERFKDYMKDPSLCCNRVSLCGFFFYLTRTSVKKGVITVACPSTALSINAENPIKGETNMKKFTEKRK